MIERRETKVESQTSLGGVAGRAGSTGTSDSFRIA
jgi:hypothetical protein